MPVSIEGDDTQLSFGVLLFLCIFYLFFDSFVDRGQGTMAVRQDLVLSIHPILFRKLYTFPNGLCG